MPVPQVIHKKQQHVGERHCPVSNEALLLLCAAATAAAATATSQTRAFRPIAGLIAFGTLSDLYKLSLNRWQAAVLAFTQVVRPLARARARGALHAHLR